MFSRFCKLPVTAMALQLKRAGKHDDGGNGMSSYGNMMNSFGGPVLVQKGPRIEALNIAKPRWQCFLVSYALQVIMLGGLLAITIAAPQIAPHLEAHVDLIAPYLAPAPRLSSVRPTARVIPIATVVKAVLPEPKVEPVAKVELPPVPVAPRPQRLQKLSPVAEVAQPQAIPAPRFDSKLLTSLPGPKAARIVATNTFGGSSATPTLQKIAPSKVRTGGFGDPNGVPVNAHGSDRPNIAAAGSFDLPAGAGYGNGSGGASGVRGTVASAGFGNGVAVQGGGGRGGNAAQGRVQSSGFATVAAPAANPEEMRQRRAVSLAATSSPVSIQSKPTPVYTAEARQLKVEGEVLLNVVFTADGQIRILTVVRGLGHGLDEAAQRAAQGIRFNPAMRDGHPVDSTATLHIIFQLS
jgi:TonB family protein